MHVLQRPPSLEGSLSWLCLQPLAKPEKQVMWLLQMAWVAGDWKMRVCTLLKACC